MQAVAEATSQSNGERQFSPHISEFPQPIFMMSGLPAKTSVGCDFSSGSKYLILTFDPYLTPKLNHCQGNFKPKRRNMKFQLDLSKSRKPIEVKVNDKLEHKIQFPDAF